MIGFGDILFPGLLISFASRYFHYILKASNNKLGIPSPDCLPELFDPYIFSLTLMLALLFGLRYDKIKKRAISNGYFLWLTIGYGVG